MPTNLPLPDYHTHTYRCGHASGSPADYVAQAQAKGLIAIGIADHLPLLPLPDPALSMSVAELPKYVAEINELKKRFPGYVFLGIEADYRPGTILEVRDLVKSYPFDYVIGSVHHLGEWGFDDPRQISRYQFEDINDLWVEYLELLGDAAESGLFSILGHLDLMKKFGHRPTRPLNKELDTLAKRLARAGIVVEINTAGLRRPAREPYPNLDILRRLNSHGVPITFGSDAHDPQEVGADFVRAVESAQQAGYKEYALLDPLHPGLFSRRPLPTP